MYKSNEDDVVFLLPPKVQGIFFWKPGTHKKKTPELSGSLAYSISQAVEGFPRELKGREPTKLPMEKSQLNGTGTTGWTVGLLGQNLSDARNSSHNLGEIVMFPTRFAPWKSGGCLGHMIQMMRFHLQKLTTCEWRNPKCPKLLPSALRLHTHLEPSTE